MCSLPVNGDLRVTLTIVIYQTEKWEVDDEVRVTDTVRERTDHLMPTDGSSNEVKLPIDSSEESSAVDYGSCNLVHIIV